MPLLVPRTSHVVPGWSRIPTTDAAPPGHTRGTRRARALARPVARSPTNQSRAREHGGGPLGGGRTGRAREPPTHCRRRWHRDGTAAPSLQSSPHAPPDAHSDASAPRPRTRLRTPTDVAAGGLARPNTEVHRGQSRVTARGAAPPVHGRGGVGLFSFRELCEKGTRSWLLSYSGALSVRRRVPEGVIPTTCRVRSVP